MYPERASAPAASAVTFQPPLPMLSEARVLPVAAADKLTLDSYQIGKKRFRRSADDLALTALRCVGVIRLGSVPTCQSVVPDFAPMRRGADRWLRRLVAVQAHGASRTFCWSGAWWTL